MLFIRDRIIENTNAAKNPLTVNPFTRFETIKITTALITNVNNPSDNMFIGRVSINSNGLISVLIIPSTKAATSAELKF